MGENDDTVVVVMLERKISGQSVYRLNESDFAAGGDIVLTYWAESRENLEQFCADFGLDKSQIQSPASIRQTL